MNWKALKEGAPFIYNDRAYFHYQVKAEYDKLSGHFYTLESRYINESDTEPKPWCFVAIVTPVQGGISLFTTDAGISFREKIKYTDIKLIN